MFLLREREGWTLHHIGEHFGVGHDTAFHAWKTVKEWPVTDQQFAAKRQAVERAL